MFKRILWISILFASFMAGAPAWAQSQADFVTAFSGKWQVYDRGMAEGTTPCQLDLANIGTDGKLGVTADGCRAPLADARTWTIDAGQLVLSDAKATALVRLGGGQKRITGGTAAGVPIILERLGGDGTGALLLAAFNASHCYYLGYGQKCAAPADLQVPAAGQQVQLAVNLGVHSEPRGDSDLLGTAKLGSCVAVQVCVTASDGPWCRVNFDTVTGWLHKLAVRQNRWPVVTFANSCH